MHALNFPLHPSLLSCLLCCLLMPAMSLSAQTVPQPSNYVPVSDAILQQPADADWMMWRRTLNSWGFSPLREIDRENVKNLELVWSSPLAEGIQEGTPLVYGGIMYMPNPGDVIQAMDAATGKLIWEYRRDIPADITDYIPATTTNRSLAIYNDAIIYTSNDDYIVALDVHSGKVKWESQIFDYHTHPAQQSGGPIIIGGKAISGRGCMPAGGPEACVITAHDANTGKELWRLNTIQRPGEGEVDSWGGIPWEERWHVGAWMMPSYDPELNLLYMGTSVTAPSPKFLLAGNEHEYLYHNSTLAISPDTGKIVWYYQHNVDHWDLDHPFERLLVDTEVSPDPASVAWINPDIEAGRVYKTLTGIPGKTGLVYTLNRENGDFLWARPTVHQTVVAGIDGVSGKVRVNPAMLFTATGQQIEVCPALSGGKNWQAGAYSPLTNMMYYPLQNTCADVTVTMDAPDSEQLYGIFGREKLTPGIEKGGTIEAISAQTGKSAWKYEQRGTTMSLLTTGGGLLFGGDIAGEFRALDQETGAVLWQTSLGSSVTGYPVSFAVNGRQYIAVGTGSSVTTDSQARLSPEIKAGRENLLYVFALPQ
ncbi:MAG: PQQ-binding-like beta-propeller repeat protein [Pseudomonadales bacterium]|nr:PQQ-binding-like beta-propeller repeat protein [Pseudomonadales bacterium]